MKQSDWPKTFKLNSRTRIFPDISVYGPLTSFNISEKLMCQFREKCITDGSEFINSSSTPGIQKLSEIFNGDYNTGYS